MHEDTQHDAPSSPVLDPQAATEAELTSVKSATMAVRLLPWRRFLARYLDTALNGTIVGAVLIILASLVLPPSFLVSLYQAISDPFVFRIISGIAIVFCAIFLNAALIGFSGFSVGKWLFGVRVLNEDNKPLGYKAALRRELMVWLKGLGLGIPLVSLFSVCRSYDLLKKNGDTSWDNKMGCQVTFRESGVKQILLGGIGVIFILLIEIISRVK